VAAIIGHIEAEFFLLDVEVEALNMKPDPLEVDEVPVSLVISIFPSEG
jgi:hypothetical protein